MLNKICWTLRSCEPVACCKLSLKKMINKLSDNYRRIVEITVKLIDRKGKKNKSLYSIWPKYICRYNFFMNNFPVFMLIFLTNKWIFNYPKETHFNKTQWYATVTQFKPFSALAKMTFQAKSFKKVLQMFLVNLWY